MTTRYKMTKKERVCFLGIVAVLALGACTGAPRNLLPIDKIGKTSELQLDSGDTVLIDVYGEDELSGEFKISADGFISMPLIERMQARGLTPGELVQSLKSRLEQGLITNPSVSVQIKTERPFFVLGEVKEPGQYAYTDGITVLGAVAAAGGFTEWSDIELMSIRRKVGDKIAEGSADPDSPVRPGDVIIVYRRIF